MAQFIEIDNYIFNKKNIRQIKITPITQSTKIAYTGIEFNDSKDFLILITCKPEKTVTIQLTETELNDLKTKLEK